jgi:hypothetical protein
MISGEAGAPLMALVVGRDTISSSSSPFILAAPLKKADCLFPPGPLLKHSELFV